MAVKLSAAFGNSATFGLDCKRILNFNSMFHQMTVTRSYFSPGTLMIFAFLTWNPSYGQGYMGKPFKDSLHHDIQTIPGRLQCALYDLGGEGIAYHDVDSINQGSGKLNPADGTYLNEFRMNEGVDISYTKFHHDIDNTQYNLVQPPENQLYVGWTEPGEWFNITVQTARAGFYSADLLYTSNRGGTISLDVNGKAATGPLP